MSCIGIDVGYGTAVVAIARRGGIDVLANEVSKRNTACMVGFTDKERKHGEAALSGINSNIKNTVTGLKQIIGKKFHSEEIQNEMKKVAYNMVDVAGSVGIPVQYDDGEVVLSPEKVMGMFLKSMQKIAEDAQGTPVTDVVLSVPAYFTETERRAMLDAAQIVGLNVLRLMNDITAVALSPTSFARQGALHVTWLRAPRRAARRAAPAWRRDGQPAWAAASCLRARWPSR